MNGIYKKNLMEKLADAVVEMDDEKAIALAEEIIENKLDLLEAVETGLVGGMARVGELYDNEEYFICELLSCADTMQAAMQVLKPYLGDTQLKTKGKIVIGSIFGDTHDIGKNIVTLLLDGAGYQVLDLGRDVSAEQFVENAMRFQADIIAISTLMTTTMENMADVIKLLEEKQVRNQFQVIIGGKPVSLAFAKKIGADGYSANAAGALRLCNQIMYKKSNRK